MSAIHSSGMMLASTTKQTDDHVRAPAARRRAVGRGATCKGAKPDMAQSVFARIGGFAVVRRVVGAFYDRVVDCELIAHHFAHTDMRRLIDHQTKFMATIMGGPGSVSDDALARTHARLGITRDEFTTMVNLMCDALEEFDVDDADIALVRRQLTDREYLIVSHGSGAQLEAEV
jgi:hemoglobin